MKKDKGKDKEVEKLIAKADNIDIRKTYTCPLCKRDFKAKIAYNNHVEKCTKFSNRLRLLLKKLRIIK